MFSVASMLRAGRRAGQGTTPADGIDKFKAQLEEGPLRPSWLQRPRLAEWSKSRLVFR